MRVRTAAILFCFCAALGVSGMAVAHHRSGTPYPLGSYRSTSGANVDCPAGYTCTGFEVDCPGVDASIDGFLATGKARGELRGLVMFFSGGGGGTWWGEHATTGEGFLSDLRDQGLTIVQVRWAAPWLAATQGEDAGPAHLGCRPATVIKWVHDHNTIPSAGTGRCGFCLSGTSGGASQIAYALSHFGLDGIVDMAAPTSGPPHADIASGCDGSARSLSYGSQTGAIDASFGFLGGGGPCAQQDTSWVPRWNEESIDVGGDYAHPKTALRFFFGARETNSAPAHAQVWADRLAASGSNEVTVQTIEGMGHNIQDSPAGLDALGASLLDDSTFEATGGSGGSGSSGSSSGSRRSSNPRSDRNANPGSTGSPDPSRLRDDPRFSNDRFRDRLPGLFAQGSDDGTRPPLWLVPVAFGAGLLIGAGGYHLVLKDRAARRRVPPDDPPGSDPTEPAEAMEREASGA